VAGDTDSHIKPEVKDPHQDWGCVALSPFCHRFEAKHDNQAGLPWLLIEFLLK